MNNILENFLKENFKKEWFKKSKKYRVWYKYDITNDTYFVFHLQKSRWSNSFYFNIWIKYTWIKDKDDWNYKIPDVDWCTISSRAEFFYIWKKEKIIELMSSWWIPSDYFERTKIFNYILDLFNSNSTKENFIKNYDYKKSTFEDYAIWLKQYL